MVNYDPECEYVLNWLPELKNIPKILLYEVYNMTESDRVKYGINDIYPRIIHPLLHENKDPKTK